MRNRKVKDPHYDIKESFNEKHGFAEYSEIAIKLLKKTISILNNHKINHFLISGTLLGYVRHNGFIPWDDDMDILVDNNILLKLDAILEENREQICIVKKDNHIKVCFIDHGIDVLGAWSGFWNQYVLNTGAKYKWPFIDLFVYDETAECLEFFGKAWELGKFFPPTKVDFLGVDAFIPNTPEYFLTMNFGSDYMEVYKSNRYIHKKEQMVSKCVTISKHMYDTIIGVSDGKLER